MTGCDTPLPPRPQDPAAPLPPLPEDPRPETVRPPLTWLYVPGDRPEVVAKALGLRPTW
ncbi:hypothetical protein SCALM49S_08765 [Streptomyces californicus]